MTRARVAVLLAVAIGGCWDDATGPAASPEARFAMVTPLMAGAVYGVVPVRDVRLQVLRLDGQTALDTTIAVTPDTDSVVVDVAVALLIAAPGNPPTERLEFRAALTGATGDTLFIAGPDTVDAVASGPPTPVATALRYVGIGHNAALVRVTPAAASLLMGDTLTLDAVVLDSAGAPLPGAPVVWSTLDPAMLSVAQPDSGRVVATTETGNGRVVARLLTGQADTVRVNLGGLVGHWTFETGEELVDRAGNFGALVLRGDAQILNGQLHVHGAGSLASGWAATSGVAGGYAGPTISNKTLVSWVSLQGLDDVATAGSAITIDRLSEDVFDGIIFAERQTNRWMNGSSFSLRTQDFTPGFQETAAGGMVQLAISYELLSPGLMRVVGFRNGDSIGAYETANAASWAAGDAEVFFGVRHGTTAGGPGALEARIEEARIYDRTLSAVEIGQLFENSPADLPQARTLDAGDRHACRLTPAGLALCWGSNVYGQLGDGTTLSRSTPAPVAGGLSFVSLTVGLHVTCGVTSAMAAYCWGLNNFGQLGDGTNGNRSVPTAVIGGQTFASLSAGNWHTCGLNTAGSPYCWGYNAQGQLGDGTLANRNSPQPVMGGQTFVAMDAGGHTCGLTSNGSAFCWGYNLFGQLGDGTTTNRTAPVAVAGGLTFESVIALSEHTCGVTSTGATRCWGWNLNGRLGDGSTTNRSVPVPVAGGLTFYALGGGEAHTCGVTVVGTAYCWGANNDGQLGDATTVDRSVPVAVSGGLTFAELSLQGVGYTCGVSTSGTAFCWGQNTFGQLGNGSTVNSSIPVVTAGVPPSAYIFPFVSDANDALGGATGSLLGGASFSGGRLTLDGSTGYAQLGTRIIPGSGSFSIAFFARESVGTGNFVEFVSQGITGSGFYVGHTPSGTLRVSDAWGDTGIPMPQDNLEHHYAVTFDVGSNVISLFVDGQLRGTRTAPIARGTSGGNITRIGRQYDPHGEFLAGTVDDLSVYSSVLSATDVQALQGRSPDLPCSAEGTVTSGAGSASVLLFENQSGEPIRIEWLDSTGARQLYVAALANGAGYAQGTFLTHPWIVTGVTSGTCRGIWLSASSGRVVRIN